MGLVHGKQLRNNTVGFTKLIADQNLNMSGNTSIFRIINLADGFATHDGVNVGQLNSAISSSYTNLIAGDGLSGGGNTSASTITFDVNVDNQGIFIVSDTIKLGNNNNEVSGDYTFLDDFHIGGNALIDGNVTILGTATTINTDNLYVKDNRIVVNSTATSGSTIPRYSGIDVFRGSGYTDSTGLLWDNTNKVWVIQSPFIDTNTGSGTTNNNPILTTESIDNGEGIFITKSNFNDGIMNGLTIDVLYDNNTIKLNGSNELYADLGSVSADTFVTSAELTGGTTLVLHRNDSVDVLADLSLLHSVDSYLTATTLTPGQILFEGAETFNNITLTGLSTTLNTSQTISANTTNIQLGGSITFEVKTDSINATHINFGTGTTQVDAELIPINYIPTLSSTTVQDALEELNTNSGLKAVPTINDKNITPDILTGNTTIKVSSSDLHLTEAPAEGSQVIILINGISYIIGSSTSDDIYFTSDGGVTAVSSINVTTTTSIYFKVDNLFELDTNDRIDLIYTVLR